MFVSLDVIVANDYEFPAHSLTEEPLGWPCSLDYIKLQDLYTKITNSFDTTLISKYDCLISTTCAPL